MFDPTSRYYTLDTVMFTTPDGQQIPYKVRRFIGQPETMQVVGQVSVRQDDRLDLISARALGVSEQYWQICDANRAMNPFDLTGPGAAGSTLNVALPQRSAS